MMRGLIDLGKNAEDERVRSVCLVAVLDRAGIRPIDRPEPEPEQRPAFDPRAYLPEELAIVEVVLKLMVEGRGQARRRPRSCRWVPQPHALRRRPEGLGLRRGCYKGSSTSTPRADFGDDLIGMGAQWSPTPSSEHRWSPHLPRETAT